MQIFYWFLIIVGGFLSGGVMFCEIIPKKFFKSDICEISVDNNPGAFNVFKHCGKKAGMLCLSLDVMKGFIPVLIASLCMDADSIAFSLAVAAPALGHAVGVFNRFRGGKCIAVSFGITLGLIPVAWYAFVALAALFVFFSTVIKINPASKRSVLVYVLFALIVCPLLAVTGMAYAATGCGLLASLPVIKFLFSKNGMVENTIKQK